MTGWGSADADSAGLPWAGRSVGLGGFEADDGRASPALRDALVGHVVAAGGVLEAAVRLRDLVGLLLRERLLIPLVAEVEEGDVPSRRPAEGEECEGHGHGDAGAAMSVPLLGLAGGGTALPAFTGVDSLAAWDRGARPVPVPAPTVAAAVLSEGCSDLMLDVAGPASACLPTPVVLALAEGRSWLPPWEDPDVAAVLDAVAVSLREECGAGELAASVPEDPTGLLVEVGLAPGMDGEELRQVLRALGGVLAAEDRLGRRVTSLAFRVRTLP